jgi:hypothetical protein
MHIILCESLHSRTLVNNLLSEISDMKGFELEIQTSLGRRVFMFRPIFNDGFILFQVTVFGRISNNYFSVLYEDGQWQLKRPHLVSGWITEVFPLLKEALELLPHNLPPLDTHDDRQPAPGDRIIREQPGEDR